MVFPIIISLSSLSLAAVAAYFSIIGLTTIFPGVFWSIVVMGSALEIGKLVTAVWLHRNWKTSGRLIKSYLAVAVIVLSGITSMGIFGFLSKSHIEQESGSFQYSSQIAMLDKKLESIDSKRLSLETQKKTNEQLKADDYLSLQRLNDRLKDLDSIISQIRDKGGFSTSSKIEKERERQTTERNTIANNKKEIQSRLENYRLKLEESIFPSLEQLEEDYLSINLDKSKIESQLKELEAEIGPVKYIAELVSDFGGPQVNSESAVRMVILILIFVFDPLAILLVVAASATFKESAGGNLPKDMLEFRNNLLIELEIHLADGKPAESFIERYKI
jgi:predicted RND superfamily exporter protein